MLYWCSLKNIYCSMATINGYCQATACMHIDYSANHTVTVSTTSNSKCDQTDGKDHPDYGIPLDNSDYGTPLHIPQNEPIVITSEAIFFKPLKLVVITEDVYNKLKDKENG